jgi:hypothetical protein
MHSPTIKTYTRTSQNTFPVMLCPIVAMEECLFAKPLLCYGLFSFAYVALVAKRRVYMGQCLTAL